MTMGYEAKILADSVSPTGVRLTTMQVTFPRIVLAEFNTHRMLSRNSASSRAIPVEKRVAAISEDPFVPHAFAKNRKGMQSTEDLTAEEAVDAERTWRSALAAAVGYAGMMARLGVHKALANRLIEPFCWHTVIVSATEWSNFFALRCHPDAQPEIRIVAEMMRDLYEQHTSFPLAYGEWHTPLLEGAERAELLKDGRERACLPGEGFTLDDLNLVSVGRCARVSSLTHDGRRAAKEDIALARRLLDSGHMSPFEHVARPVHDVEREHQGNFRGWVQFRKTIKNEHDFGRILADRANASRGAS